MSKLFVASEERQEMPCSPAEWLLPWTSSSYFKHARAHVSYGFRYTQHTLLVPQCHCTSVRATVRCMYVPQCHCPPSYVPLVHYYSLFSLLTVIMVDVCYVATKPCGLLLLLTRRIYLRSRTAACMPACLHPHACLSHSAPP